MKKKQNMKQRLFSSMHTHTLFCDGKDDIETMCRSAYENKVYAIGFSAHAPISKQIGKESEWNLEEEKVEEYIKEVFAARERWNEKLKVFIGFEADYIKGIRSPADSDIKALSLDYIIGSVHYLFPENGADFFTVDGSKEEFEKGLKEGYNGNLEFLMHSYYDAQLEMIKQGGFDILGHPDILKKNCNKIKYPYIESVQEAEKERQKEIAIAASKTGIVIEVNTGGINRNKIDEVYPSLPFLKIIKKYKIPVIITADAHCAKDIIGNYDIAINTLICANFKEHVLFNGKINNIAVWQKENLK
ncbi:MAG: histidinol-phosphatase [Treponema sp.]|nr:histidinol-phosphatase [Treponema sp.]MCL2251765.1 histidinol-phosphatase [Treponema sp.]